MPGDEGKIFNWPFYLNKMTATEIQNAVETEKIAIFVVGSIEEHGEHLPIDTDLATAEYLAFHGLENARKQIGKPVAYIAPSIPYGGPSLKMNWQGTIQLRPEVLIEVVRDVGDGLYLTGFRYVIILNGCFGNIPALMVATGQLQQNHPDGNFLLVDSIWAQPDVIQSVRESAPGYSGHADEFETSVALVIDPKNVQMDKARRESYKHPSSEISLDFNSAMPFFWPIPFDRATKSGVIGDATLASAEKGHKILQANIERISSIICHVYSIASSNQH